jgi:hypothetical protein
MTYGDFEAIKKIVFLWSDNNMELMRIYVLAFPIKVVRGDVVGWGAALQSERSPVRFPVESFEFYTDFFLRPQYGPRVDTASHRKEYQEYLLGRKGGRWVSLTNLPPACADCLEIWVPQSPGNLSSYLGV